MTERERYRTLGIYYTLVTGNQAKAIENYELLVEKYPADGIGWNNLGVAYFYDLQFDKATEVGAQLVELFPGNPAFKANYALFAMYAGNLSLGRTEAEKLLEKQPDYFLAYLPVAIAYIAEGDLEQAQATYQRMAEQGERARSVATTGLADIALLQGDFNRAADLLRAGREQDLAFGNSVGHDYKGVYLAKAMVGRGDREEAIRLLGESTEDSAAISHLVPAALLYIELGLPEQARAISMRLGATLQENQRAAARGAVGAQHPHVVVLVARRRQGDFLAAVDALNASLQRRDFWLTRFYRGQAYALTGNHAEALGEFEICLERLGESTALFLDDVPTFQYHAELYYWLGRTKQAMGSVKGAREDLERYLELRVESDPSPVTEDARQRLAELPGKVQTATASDAIQRMDLPPYVGSTRARFTKT